MRKAALIVLATLGACTTDAYPCISNHSALEQHALVDGKVPVAWRSPVAPTTGLAYSDDEFNELLAEIRITIDELAASNKAVTEIEASLDRYVSERTIDPGEAAYGLRLAASRLLELNQPSCS